MVSCDASAPGKVILFGEHSVVHGRLAIASSIDLRTIVSLDSFCHEGINITIPSQAVDCHFNVATISDVIARHFSECSTGPTSCPSLLQSELISMVKQQLAPTVASSMAAGVAAFLFLHNRIVGSKSTSATVSTSIPIGAGLGSSAAFCVATSAALLASAGALCPNPTHTVPSTADFDTSDSGRPWTEIRGNAELALVNNWAFEGEKIIHGRPSGVDNNVSCYGRILTFQSGAVTRLPACRIVRALLTNTLVPRDTKKLVSRVTRSRERHPEAMESIFEAMDAIAKESVSILSNEGELSAMAAYESLRELVELNQGLLDAIGVGHESIAAICRITKGFGFSSKLTGAGGGGCVLTLLSPDVEEDLVASLRRSLQSNGYDCFEAVVGGPGVFLRAPS